MIVAISDGYGDPHSSYGLPADGGQRVMPRSGGHPGSNPADDNSFLGHEVGAWKGAGAAWRGDDLDRTLTPQATDTRPADMQQDSSLRLAGSELSFTAGDDVFRRTQDSMDYCSSRRQKSFADMRPSGGHDLSQPATGRMLNGSADRYPAMYDTGPGACWRF